MCRYGLQKPCCGEPKYWCCRWRCDAALALDKARQLPQIPRMSNQSIQANRAPVLAV
jgi:hypothetical protein